MNAAAILWLAGAVPVFLAAASATRSYLNNGLPWVLGGSLLLYCIGNLMMVRLMRESGLGVAISASSVAQLILINVIAFAIFHERPPVTQLIGMGLGLVGFLLMVWPQAKA
ncbi:hypothetical protein E3C22_14790 [Jiella endophytica]|uniref:EamA domain-containing protein n=1 Tax=Jiella endophytica TaxID=2558362 RepID=A0A4Y8RI73_9HYPH|nr:hypothetical protein [Jiella endophytica]TFF21925.1 hypothetical protein E3C22_14790 [Jiella endophytica]